MIEGQKHHAVGPGKPRAQVAREAVNLATGERIAFVSLQRIARSLGANRVVIETGSVTLADVVVVFWRPHRDIGWTGPKATARGSVSVGRWRVPIEGARWLIERGGWAMVYAERKGGNDA